MNRPDSCYAVPSSISPDAIVVTINGREYHWCGGYGAVLTSHERFVVAGSTRVIGGVLFNARYIHSRGWLKRPSVCWTVPNDVISNEWIEAFRAALFGVGRFVNVVGQRSDQSHAKA